ncbi:hypothetical protein T06_502 [Trichinella sp. T6]|nr:hypothetical protein T06_502 [Trichinella sp. T6]
MVRMNRAPDGATLVISATRQDKPFHNFLVPKNPGSNVDIPTVIEMFQKFKLSRDEVEQWLGDYDTPLFEALTEDEILEAVEKDED